MHCHARLPSDRYSVILTYVQTNWKKKQKTNHKMTGTKLYFLWEIKVVLAGGSRVVRLLKKMNPAELVVSTTSTGW